MLEYLKRHHATCRTILVEKTDRLYRNLKDWVTLDGLDLEIHLVKENWIVSPNSRSSEKLMHGMKVLMAKNYIDNLSEETLKGMMEKARTGTYPSYAPVGYRNVDGADGKRIIVPDPDAASVITELFERFAAGRHSVKALVNEFNAASMKLRGQKLNRQRSSSNPPKTSLYRGFRLGGHHVHGLSCVTGDSRMLAARPEVVGCPRQKQDSESEARFRLHRARPLRPLWMPICRRTEKGEVYLLSLHRKPREMPGALYTAGSPDKRICEGTQ
jgi:DNA invertase Pin-like site-specific DNA recombinase